MPFRPRLTLGASGLGWTLTLTLDVPIKMSDRIPQPVLASAAADAVFRAWAIWPPHTMPEGPL